MHIEPLINDYLTRVEVMQLATSANNKPWACTVHFLHTPDHKLYWISDGERRHSQEIAHNPHVSVAMAIKTTAPVIGVQIEGQAAQVTDTTERDRVARLIAARHNRPVEEIQAGFNAPTPKFLYCLTPSLIAIFDKQTFPDAPKQEWRIGAT